MKHSLKTKAYKPVKTLLVLEYKDGCLVSVEVRAQEVFLKHPGFLRKLLAVVPELESELEGAFTALSDKLYLHAKEPAGDKVRDAVQTFKAVWFSTFSKEYKPSNKDLQIGNLHLFTDDRIRCYLTHTKLSWMAKSMAGFANLDTQNQITLLLDNPHGFPAEPDSEYLGKLPMDKRAAYIEYYRNKGWKAEKIQVGITTVWNFNKP